MARGRGHGAGHGRPVVHLRGAVVPDGPGAAGGRSPVASDAAPLGVFVFVCAGALWLQFWGPLHEYGSPFTLGYFETDLRGFYVPSGMLWLTTTGSAAFAASYVPGATENMAYLGSPLLVAASIMGIARIDDQRTRLLLY